VPTACHQFLEDAPLRRRRVEMERLRIEVSGEGDNVFLGYVKTVRSKSVAHVQVFQVKLGHELFSARFSFCHGS
jgi:hypothetical protein